MADYIVKDTELTSVANSIRTAGDTSSLLTFPDGFIGAITNISGGGGNPNYVQTITGTAANPFGDGNIDYYSNLAHAIQNKTATVIVHMGTAQILGMDIDMYIDSSGTATFDGQYAFLPDDTNYMAFHAQWDRINETYYLHSVSKAAGFVDGSGYAAIIQTVTTIIWHPLP